MILKTILGKRTHSTALFIEIVIVTIIGWLIIEPVAVKTTTAMTPAGYDHDRLVKATITYLDSNSPEYDKSNENEDPEKLYGNLLHMIRDREGVEKATYTLYQSFESSGRSSSGLEADSAYKKKGIEELGFDMSCIEFYPNTDFFATFGIKDANGNDFQEPETDNNSYIISHSVAKAVFPDSTAIGKDLFEPAKWRPNSTVVGVTADMPYKKGDGRIGTYYTARDFKGWNKPYAITMRLGEGVNPRTFIEKLTADLSKYRSGNLYLTHPVYMNDQRDAVFAEMQRDLTQKWIIVFSFLSMYFWAWPAHSMCSARHEYLMQG